MGETGVFMQIIQLALSVLTIAGMWKVFEKAGQPGWAAIIPIYNFIVLLKIVGKPWWWLFLTLLVFIFGIGIIWIIWTLNLLSLSFGKSTGFTIGLIFLPFIFLPMLGFGDAEYQGPAAADAAQNYPEYAE